MRARALAGTRRPDRRRMELMLVVIACLVYTTMPGLVSLVQSGRVYDLENSTSSVALTGLAVRLQTPLLLVLVAVCAIVTLANIRIALRRGLGRFVLVFGALATALAVNSVLVGSVNRGTLLVGAVGLAIWAIGPSLDDLRVFGDFATALAAVTLLLAIVWPAAWQVADEKGFFGEEVLAGVFSQMNVLGMSLAALT